MNCFEGCIFHLNMNIKALKERQLNPSIRVIFNLVLLFCVGVPVLVFAGMMTPFQRGFYCTDDSLSYPLKESTVSIKCVILIGVIVPILAILIVETVKDSSPNQANNVNPRVICMPKMITTINMIGYFLFGCGCSQTLTDILKYSIGRLRPHFHAACNTNWTAIADNCFDKLAKHPEYIYPIPCMNDDHHVRDARQSFPSGHSSFSAFTMFYLIIYLQHRITWQHPTLLKPFIQFLCLLFTVYSSISRVFDYHHHWSDVLFGFVLGAIMAYLIARFVSGLIKGNRNHEKKVEQGNTKQKLEIL